MVFELESRQLVLESTHKTSVKSDKCGILFPFWSARSGAVREPYVIDMLVDVCMEYGQK